MPRCEAENAPCELAFFIAGFGAVMAVIIVRYSISYC